MFAGRSALGHLASLPSEIKRNRTACRNPASLKSLPRTDRLWIVWPFDTDPQFTTLDLLASRAGCIILSRLASAAATSAVWGQSYSYDGFGNLTDQIVTALKQYFVTRVRGGGR